MAANRLTRTVSRAAPTLLWVVLCEVATALPAAAGQQASARGGADHADSSAIVGHVTARDSHDPINRARVTVAGTALETTTDSVGRFSFTNLDAGTFVIEIRAIGYAPASWGVSLKPHQMITHQFDLEPLAYELPEVVVKGKTPLSARRYADFERRRHSGMGAFLTQEFIERANPSSLVDVLVTVRGVQQVCISNQCVAKMVRSPPGCYPQYYLDGNESTPYFARLTPPEDIKGVEIYRGASETPGEFQGSNSGCGVIAIWTKSAP
jgi:CarboxypepD_reg-like domain